MISFSRIFVFFFFFSFFSCVSSLNHPSSILSSSSNPISCLDTGNHSVFSIFIDGADVGREVRSDIIEDGPNGPRRSILSHFVKNEKFGSILFQNVFVRQETTDLSTGRLINTFFSKKDQVSPQVVHIFSESNTFQRVSFSSFLSPKEFKQDTIFLLGNEIIGFRLVDYLRDIILTNRSPSIISYFDSQLNSPVKLKILSPKFSSLTLEGNIINGYWINILNFDHDVVVYRYFFDVHGTLFAEEFPDLHEMRIRVMGSVSFPNDTSDLIVGLRSNAYIYDPNIASSALYHISSSPDRLDKLSILSEPANHTINRISDSLLELRVIAGAPDKNFPPTKEDLSSSIYISPRNPTIIGALTYLKSFGKSGHLIYKRRLNVTSVISQLSLLSHSLKLWSDPNQSAAIIMQYTNSLIPDKRHTFSMVDASTTLENGSGDCTEHAVLFASFMRAHKIPTRLVTGMLLTPGGLWAYHMWNSYWDGERWHSIDPSTLSYRTGALYVALGSGFSSFTQVRDRLSDFMWRTFNGVSFNLIEASNNGEILSLAKPVGLEKLLGETALFNAAVLSERGNYNGALSFLDDHITEDSRTISVKLMRIELLMNAGSFKSALDNILLVRSETSSPENSFILDRFEFICLLHLKQFNKAKSILSRLSSLISDISEIDLLRSYFLNYSGKFSDSLSILKQIILKYPENLDALYHFSLFVSLSDHPNRSDLLSAIDFSFRSVRLSYYSNSDYLETLSRLLAKDGRFGVASWYVDHALILSPEKSSLRSLQKDFSTINSCFINTD